MHNYKEKNLKGGAEINVLLQTPTSFPPHRCGTTESECKL